MFHIISSPYSPRGAAQPKRQIPAPPLLLVQDKATLTEEFEKRTAPTCSSLAASS